jgi:CubicO group peptidase (beta-lactamase class C family)
MLKEFLQTAIADRYFPGAALAVIRGESVEILRVGNHTFEADSPVITANSIYDVASITKSIPTSCLALQLIESGKLHLDDKLITYIPEYVGNYREDITIEHLLRQSLTYSLRLSALKDEAPGDILEAIYVAEMKTKPGEAVYHSNATSILLSLILERVTGKPLDVVADEAFFTPLGMKHTTFHPDTSAVPTEYDRWRARIVQGEVHDESAFVLKNLHIPGSAGLFSSVNDLTLFIQMLLKGGEGYFSRSMVESMGTGLGWEVARPYMGEGATAHTFGKRGFTGCFVLVDVEKQLGVVFLANTTFPRRKPEQIHQDINEALRTNVMNLIWKL